MKIRLIHIFTFIRNTRPKKFLNYYINRDLIKSGYSLKVDVSPLPNKQLSRQIFILSSAINTGQDSVNYNSKHSAEERLAEVMCGINSVKLHFPNAEIFYLDNTKINPDHESQLRCTSVRYENFRLNPLMAASKKIPNKGVAWSLTNLLFLIQSGRALIGKDVFFMNGRYAVSDLTVQVSNNLPQENALSINFAKTNVQTIIFSLTAFNVEKAVRMFKFAYILSLCGYSVEDVFGIFYRKVNYVKAWGVDGTVNGIYPHKV